MSLQRTHIQTTGEAPSAPMRETFVAPTLLPVCCACGLIRDDTRLSPGREHWVSQRMYHDTHGVNPTELALTHTYCPTCFTNVQDTVRQSFQQMGTPP